MENRSLWKALKSLKRRREMVGRQLDIAYTKEDTLLYLSLEERYKRLAQIIDRLLYRLRSKGANLNELERL